MSEEVTIVNSKDLANNIGNLVSVQFNNSINKLIANQNAISSTQKILDLESSREQAILFQRMLSSLENFKANITLDAKKDGDTGLLGYLIKGLGLLGSGMLAFMGGFASGYFENFKKIIIDPIFKALEPIIDLVKNAVTKVGDAFKADVLDPFSKKIDDIKALFGPDGSIGKFFTKVKDFFNTKLLEPIATKIDDIKALFGPDGSIGKFFTKVKDFFNTKLLEPISLAIDDIKALFGPDGSIGKFFTKVKDFFNTKLLEPISLVIDDIKALFGPDGSIGKFFTKVKDFFNTKLLEPISLVIDNIKALFSAEGGTTVGKTLNKIKSFFTGSFGNTITTVIDYFKEFKFEDSFIGKTLSKVKGFFGTTAGEGGIFSKITDFISPLTDFKLPDGVSKILGGIGKIFGKVFFVVDLFMGFFAAFEAFEETEGSLADKIIAAIKAFIDEVIFGLPNFLIDLVGKGAAAIFKLFGQEDAAANIEKVTENFSLMDVLSENFEILVNELPNWIDKIFDFDFKLPDGVSEILGGIGKIFGKVFFVVDLFMAFSTAFEAFNETEGSFADKIIAAIKAFIDEVVFGLPNFLIDLVGQGAAAIFKLFGKEDTAANIEEATKDFSLMDVLSENFEKLLDGISKFFDNLFSIDVNSIIKSIPGGETLMKLFGAGESSKARTQLASIGLEQGSTDFGKWDVDIEELRNKIQGMNKEQLEMIQNNIASLAMSDEIDNLKEVEEVLAEKARGFKTGGLVEGTGLAVLHGTPSQPELVLDNQATAVFMKAAQLLTGSQNMIMSQSSQPVVINNIDNSQRNPVISNQATQIKVPDSPRQGETTLAMMNMAYAMG